MNGKHVNIKHHYSGTCSRAVLTENVLLLFGIGGAAKTVVVYNCPLSHRKCESARFGICCRHLNRDDE